MAKIKSVLILLAVVMSTEARARPRPHVVIIMADDYGSYDASYRGSNQVLTPNIDALGYNGVIFDRFYTPQMCTPSRASVMTGKYPHSVGMQHWVIPATEAWGLGLNETLMSNYFQDAGYNTHLVGKWHLGFFQEKYTPTFRGFDSFFGYYNGFFDYYNYTYIEQANGFLGYDFRKDTEIYKSMKPRTYATDLLTDEAIRIIKNHDKKEAPLFLMLNQIAPHTGNNYDLFQAPKSEVDKFGYINDPNRRTLAAMISKLDESVGKVVTTLREEGMLDNSIILFYSDNGAPTTGLYANLGSNYPFRGQKNGPWEGAGRNLGVIYSPYILNNQRVYDGYFHTADILPTLTSAAGINIGNRKIDGFNQWRNILVRAKSPRKEVVTTLDSNFGFSGIISGKWKFVNGTSPNKADGFLGGIQEVNMTNSAYANAVLTSEVNKALKGFKLGINSPLTASKIKQLRKQATTDCRESENPIVQCNSYESPCLFNIQDDPCERTNVASLFPKELAKLKQRWIELLATATPTRRTFINDPLSDPSLYEGAWTWWVPDKAY